MGYITSDSSQPFNIPYLRCSRASPGYALCPRSRADVVRNGDHPEQINVLVTSDLGHLLIDFCPRNPHIHVAFYRAPGLLNLRLDRPLLNPHLPMAPGLVGR